MSSRRSRFLDPARAVLRRLAIRLARALAGRPAGPASGGVVFRHYL